MPHGLAEGQTFSSLSYTSSTYDPSQKQFLVDVQGYWNNPDFSFGGLTNGVSAVPETSTAMLLLAGLGLVGAACRRRAA